MHMTPQELRRRLEETRTLQPGSAQRLQQHRELAEQCSTFVPNLLALSRALQLSDAGTDAPAHLSESERVLRAAVEVSGEEASALIELAHFVDVVRDSPTEAEALFAEAARRASRQLEEAWAGWIGVLGEQEKLEAALELASRAQRMFPDSELITEAVEFAKRCAAP
ncbi:hypothetical protein ATI61_107397 [Archangium gephyra]|uniref:Tetratricopeptide repeat protein n=1 Tax=Archangium gephyra TaxID=48 RepID=A0ABX9JZ25_9BACT|nr:hypothetical protein [Archangium gephyra]REG29701.1 hypothetical protein ATI61_107397 [Archangium gephyra]